MSIRRLFHNGVFLITEEKRCPLYSRGEEIVLHEGTLTFPRAKATCMALVQGLMAGREGSARSESEQDFECPGCGGYIRFELKKKHSYATKQMQMLDAMEKREKLKQSSHLSYVLRGIEVFSGLSDDELFELSTLFVTIEYPWQFPIIQKGDPAGKLYVLVSGSAEVVSEDGIAFVNLTSGSIFGEMSLLSGSVANSSVIATEPCVVAEMSRKDFNYALEKFPILNKLFYKFMVTRVSELNSQYVEKMRFGLYGKVSEIHPIEVCQLIHSGRKTGTLVIESPEETATAVFNTGELVFMEFRGLSGKSGLLEMLKIESGSFRFNTGITVTQKKLQPFGEFMSLLIECIQWLDENNASSLRNV